MNDIKYITDILDEIGEDIRDLDAELELREQFRAQQDEGDDFDYEVAYACF
jgi:hypothetical protein